MTMSLAELFHACNLAGVQLARHGTQLKLRSGTPGAISEGIRDAALEHKAELLRLLPDLERTKELFPGPREREQGMASPVPGGQGQAPALGINSFVRFDDRPALTPDPEHLAEHQAIEQEGCGRTDPEMLQQ